MASCTKRISTLGYMPQKKEDSRSVIFTSHTLRQPRQSPKTGANPLFLAQNGDNVVGCDYASQGSILFEHRERQQIVFIE